jgi:Fe-S cluster biogenesis protein NfuA
MENVMKERLEMVLGEIRAILKADESELQFIGLSEDGILQVRLIGGCGTCESAIIPLKKGIERMVIEQVPEIKKVEVL